MSILSQQLRISQKAFTNYIRANPAAQSLSYKSGYCGNGGQYPDHREFFDSDSTVDGSNIKESETAPDFSNLEVFIANAKAAAEIKARMEN